jgi:hypothetical protein
MMDRRDGVEWNLPAIPISEHGHCGSFQIGYTAFSQSSSNKGYSDEEFADVDIRRNAVKLLDDSGVNF